jgi:hypothetical protein
MAWAMAHDAAGEAAEDPSIQGFLAVAREFDKLPHQGFQPGAYYNEAGDFLEVYWKRCPRVAHWVNHLLTQMRCAASAEDAGHEECGGQIIGVQVSWTKFILSRANTFITPDLPNPSPAVQEAKDKGICRICRRELKVGSAPAGVKERFGSQVYGDSIVFNMGEEYAHQACLNMEKKGVNEGID